MTCDPPESMVAVRTVGRIGQVALSWRPRMRRRLGPLVRGRSTRADVLVVMEGVVGVVLGLDLGESVVGVVAVGLSGAVGVFVGVEEVDVDAGGAVRLEGLEEPS